MDWIATVLTLSVPVLGALGLLYKNVRDTQRADKQAEADTKKIEQEQREAEQKRIERIADRLQVQLDKALDRLDAVETVNSQLRTQQNANMKDIVIMRAEVEQLLKDNDRLTKEIGTLRSQLDTKDKVIQEQDGRIKQQEKRIHELEDEYKRVKTQVALLVKQLKEAQLPLPDGVEHGEENGGGG